MDRLQGMRTFVAVADAAGFAPAARRLNTSPPSVTRAVAELEQRLGARLLHRTTRSVRLTEAGRRYLADCRRILAEIEDAERQAAGQETVPRGLVTLTAPVMLGRIVVVPAVLDLLARYAEIRVSTIFVDRVVHLVDEGIDVAVRIADLPDSSLVAVRVGQVRRVLCASPGYLDARGRPTRPADLAAHAVIDFVNLTPNGEWSLIEDGRRRAFRPRARLQTGSADAAIAAACAGHGITRVLSYMIASAVERGELEVVLEDFTPPAVPVHVVHKELGRTSSRVRTAVDHLAEHLRRHPALA